MNIKNNKRIILNVLYIILSYLIVVFCIKGGLLNRQYLNVIVPICINIMLAVSLNLVTGFLGELSLGHAGFMSIGAYVSAIITTTFAGYSPIVVFFVALTAAGVAAGIFGFLIGVPVLRLKGDYLAIVTLAFGEIIKSVINYLKITGGAKGLSRIPIYSNYENITVVFIITVLTIVFIVNFVNSRDGRCVTAIRDNDIAAQSIGVKVSKYKVLAFVVASVFAGIAGAIYAHNVGLIKPGTFDYNKSIEILVIVVLGGMGSIRGSIISAFILTLIPEFLRGMDEFRMFIYAIVLIAMMIFNNSNIKKGLLANKTLSKLFVRRNV